MTDPTILPSETPGLDALDDEQRAAVTHDRGPLLIVAGAGTGKTTVITRRIARLIETGRARPSGILALAFNEKAAAELTERVDEIVPYGYADAHIATFHAFGEEVLQAHGMEIGIAPGFRVLDQAGQAMFLAERLEELGLRRYAPLSHPTKFLDELGRFFNRAKDEPLRPEDLGAYAAARAAEGQPGDGAGSTGDPAALDDAERFAELARAYDRYNRLLWESGFLDFGDLLALTLRLFTDSPRTLQRLQERYRYILVDEFQDTNPVQFKMVQRLAEPHRNLAVVGDDDQSIYRFRGAHLRNILTFETAYPDAARIVLRMNYRSTRQILRVARRVILNNKERLETQGGFSKELESDRTGPEPRVREYPTEGEEADAVAREIEEAVSSGRRRCRDVAILVRANKHAEPFLRALDARGVPYYFSGSRGLFQRPEVKELIALLHSIHQETRHEYLYVLARDAYGVPEEDLARLTHALDRESGSFRTLLRRAAQGAGAMEITDGARGALGRMLEDLGELAEFARGHRTGEVLYHYLDRRGIIRELAASRAFEDEARARNIVKFFSLIRSFEAVAVTDRVPLFLRHLDGLTEHGEDPAVAELDAEADVVQVLTVHKAKGLEFPAVYMVQAASDRFPMRARSRAPEIPAALAEGVHEGREMHKEEERRLFYVALTRAKEELTATYALHYGHGSASRARKPSEFLAEAFDLGKPVAPRKKRGIREELERHRPETEAGRAPVPPATPREPIHLSSRRLEDYDTCPLKYRFLHLLSVEPILTRDHRVNFGHAVHQAVAFALDRKRRGETPDPDRVEQVFRANWRSEGYRNEEHARRRFEQGLAAVRDFLEKERDAPPPTDVERDFRVKWMDVILVGRMDRVDEGPEGVSVIDYKTSELDDDAKADEKARDSLQLRVYALAHRELTGRIPERVELRYVLTGARGTASPGEAMLERTREKIEAIAEGIRAGRFDARPSEYSCSICACRPICKESAV
jgi:DNA helicase-2/ATP-dependent DNA helicase PcrA